VKPAKLSEYQPVLNESDLYDYDDIFSQKHGVGDAPVATFGDRFDGPVAAVAALIDPSAPTLMDQ
jgi:hypothetical protein